MFYKVSETGLFHKNNCNVNQDALFCATKNNASVITLADGVSTCAKAKEGAQIASKGISKLFIENPELFLKCTNQKRAELVIPQLQFMLEQKSKYTSYPVEEFSSTIASVLYDADKKKLMYFSLGDSLLLIVKNREISVLCAPSESKDGCCVTTSFSARQMVQTDVLDCDDFDYVIIFSDGAWQELLDGTKLRSEISELLKCGQFSRLERYLHKQNCSDDYSFIVLDNVHELDKYKNNNASNQHGNAWALNKMRV